MPKLDFSHYYLYDEIKQFLEQVAVEYPDLVSVSSIGKSYEGREILLATLTNRGSGPDTEKPAYWIDANTHAGEVTGSAVALYTIDYYASSYGKDPRITALLDNYTIYVLPRITVDGSEKYLTSPHYLRSSTRRYPFIEDREGLYPDDIDGDGKILQMRIEDPNGAWRASKEDPRVMCRRGPDDIFTGSEAYYHIVSEGIINEWDGHAIKLAPAREGLDLNRNYPHDWAPEGEQRGAGDYPFSEPETRAEAEFWAAHHNINGFLSYHTYSGVILRPYSTHPDEHFATHDLDVYKLIGERGTELTGYPCISVFHGFAYDPKEPMHGAMDDYAFDFYGWFGFTTELWDPPKQAGIEVTDFIGWMKFHPEEDDLKLMRWNDEQQGGKAFIPWHDFTHPQLGKVEIGGWDTKNYWTNAPAASLPELCEKHSQFTLAHALMSPRLEVRRADVQKEAEGVYVVSVVIANKGFLPTYTSHRAKDRKILRPIEAHIKLPSGAKLLAGDKDQEIGQLEGRSNKIHGGFFASRDVTDHEKRLEWVVSLAGGTSGEAEVEVTVQSERAGTIRKRLTLT
ncbi:MAG: M14 family metallopeptidase [Chloroflexota bacterium]|nr:M14 family metallopeptidase [Chloroflexota bacterium]